MRRTESHVYMYIYINTYIHVYKRTSIYHIYVLSLKYGRKWLTCCSFLQCVAVCSESVCCSVFSVLKCVVCIHIYLHVSSLAKDVVEALIPLRQDGGQMQITLVNAKRTKLIDTLIFGTAHIRNIVGDRGKRAVRPPGAFRLIITTPAMRSLAGRSLSLMCLCLCYMAC